MTSSIPAKHQPAARADVHSFAAAIEGDPVDTILELLDVLGLDAKALSKAKKKQKPTPSSFSKAKWDDVAERFNISAEFFYMSFPLFDYPHCHLPPSFHRRILVDAARWLDVYQDRGNQDKDAARVRLMDGWHVPVCALFRGRLVDTPEHALPETQYSSGGQVEHEVYMFAGIILIMVEMKVSLSSSEKDNVAQVMLELASAYQLNADKSFDEQPPVFALLTDLKTFRFFSYDGAQFLRGDEIDASSASRLRFMASMIPVTEMLFSILLHGFILNLRAVVAKSKKHNLLAGDGSMISSAGVVKPFEPGSSSGPRRSLDQWQKALAAAEQSQSILSHCSRTSRDAAEVDGMQGLTFLLESVNYLPKVSYVQEDWTEEELLQAADEMLDKIYSNS